MRIRSVKPSFWTDEVLAELPDPARLMYIGLWGLADDDGWLRWSARAVAAELYPYRSVRVREKQVTEWADRLVKLGRLVLYDCGHAEIPTLDRHQLPGGHRVEAVHRDHQRQCEGLDVPGPGSRPKGRREPKGAPAEPPRSPGEPPLVGGGKGGEVKVGEVAAAAAQPTPSKNLNGDPLPLEARTTTDLYRLFEALTGERPNPNARKWMDDMTVVAGDRALVAALMRRWWTEGRPHNKRLLGWTKYQLEEAS